MNGHTSNWSSLYNNSVTQYLGFHLLNIPYIKNAVFTPFDRDREEKALIACFDADSRALYQQVVPTIESFVLTQFVNYFEKNERFSNYIQNDISFYRDIVRFLIAEITANLISMTRDEYREGGLSINQIIENTRIVVKSQIDQHQNAIKKIYDLADLKASQGTDRLAVEKERDLLLKKELQSATDTFLLLVFPLGAEDLPLRLGVRDLVFSFLKDLFADLIVQFCHTAYYSEIKKDSEMLAKRFGKIEPAEDLSGEQKKAITLENLKIDARVIRYKQLSRTLAADLLEKYFQPEMLESFGFICANAALREYLQKVLADLIFKITAHQAMRLAPNDEFPLASLVQDITGQADIYLDEKEDFGQFVKIVLSSLCADPSKELLYMVVPPYREMLYSMLETKFLPGILSKYYRKAHTLQIGLDGVKSELNTLYAKKVNADCNYVNSLCVYLAKWGTQSLANYMCAENSKLASKLEALIPAKYFSLLEPGAKDILGKNIRCFSDEVPKLKLLESHIHGALLTLLTNAVKNIAKVEYKEGVPPQQLFTTFLERTLGLINRHLESVHDSLTDPRGVTHWVFRKSIKESFLTKGRLHPAMQGPAQRAEYFVQLTKRFLNIIEFNCIPLTEEMSNLLRSNILPGILEEVVSGLTKPEVIDKALLAFCNMESDFTKDLEKAEFTQVLGEIEEISRGITSFLSDVENSPNDAKWLEEKGRLTQKIVDVQRRLYFFQNIDERKKLLDDLNAIKNDIIPLLPQKEPLTVEGIKSKVAGSADSKGLEATLLEMKETYASSVPSDTDRSDPFNEACGKLVLNFINLLPHNKLTKRAYGLKNIQDIISVTLGKAVRKQANEGSFLKHLNKGAERALPAMVDEKGDWFGTNGETEFLLGSWEVVEAGVVEHGNRFFKRVGNIDYQFIPSKKKPFIPAKTPRSSVEKLADYGKLKTELNNAILATADNATRQGVIGFFKSQFETLRDSKNLFIVEVHSLQKDYSVLQPQDFSFRVWIKTCLFATSVILGMDEYGRSIAKTYNDPTTFLRKFCDLVEKVVTFLLHPIVEIIFSVINLYVKELTRESLSMIHMGIHQNLVYEILDEFFSEIDK